MNNITKASYVTVAAADSTNEAKAAADFVCTGKNDELTIQAAVDKCAAECKNVYLFNGCYRIDAFYDKQDGGISCAICFPNAMREIKFIGQNSIYQKDGIGVRLYVTEKALDSVEDDVDVIRTVWTKAGISNGSALAIENISVGLSHNQKPVRCIDLRRCDRPELKNIKLIAFIDMEAGLGKPPVPAIEGCIGLTTTDGSNAHYSNYTNVSATGFYEAIQVSGEHVVLINCAAIMNVYGYTFGNYKVNCGANHPITLINCMDERNVNLPLFNACGDAGIQGGQEVTMISFNIERIAEQTPGKVLGDLMREVHPGTWCGNIDFTAQPAWGHINEKNFQLWENDGSGTGFRTRNNNHKTVCSTAERLSYYPTYAQQIFDTDLNKMVICVDVENKKWVDFNGNTV